MHEQGRRRVFEGWRSAHLYLYRCCASGKTPVTPGRAVRGLSHVEEVVKTQPAGK